MLWGALDTFRADDILGLVGRASATGVLRFLGPETAGAVFCNDGDVTFATTDSARDLVSILTDGGFLRPDGAVTDTTSLALELRRGEVDAQALHEFVRQHTEDATFELALWETGEFRFEEGTDHTLQDAFRYPIGSLLVSVRARRSEWNSFKTVLPSTDVVVMQVPARGGDDGDLTLSRAQWRLLVAVDGRRTVRALAGELGLGLFATCKLVFGLMEQGLLAVNDTPSIHLDGPERAPVPRYDELILPPLNGNGHAPAPVMVGAAPAEAPQSFAASMGLPEVDYVDATERPSRDLILQLLSAVKEL